nr:hypothetical protein [Tanacetum cinerariifolium]
SSVLADCSNTSTSNGKSSASSGNTSSLPSSSTLLCFKEEIKAILWEFGFDFFSSLPPNVLRIAAHSSFAVLYLLNLNWCSSGRDSSRVVLAFTSFFFLCISSVVIVTVLPDFASAPLVVFVSFGSIIAGLYKNHRIQLLPIELNGHVEDIVESGTAIAQIFLVHSLIFKDGIEIYTLAERRYPLTKETLEWMLALRLIDESESEAVFDLLRFIQKKIDESRSHDGSEKDL